MAAKKAPSKRYTTGTSYSGKHRGLRRHVTATLEQWEELDAKARKHGMSCSQWLLALGLHAK